MKCLCSSVKYNVDRPDDKEQAAGDVCSSVKLAETSHRLKKVGNHEKVIDVSSHI